MSYLSHRLIPKFRLSSVALAMLVLAALAPAAVAQPITFRHENLSDLRGLLNVFRTFGQACLKQPVDRDLPAKIVPEGYRVVTFAAHMGWEEGGQSGNIAILSKTGLEQGDWDGGHPIVNFSMPSEDEPNGRCSVTWKRAWDYEEGREDIALGMFGVFDAQVSYYLAATRASKPDDSFTLNRTTYAGVSEWYGWCWDGNLCAFKVLYEFDPETGIDISIYRGPVLRKG